MIGRRDSATRAPEGTLVMLALDALLRYRDEGYLHEGDTLFAQIVESLPDGE